MKDSFPKTPETNYPVPPIETVQYPDGSANYEVTAMGAQVDLSGSDHHFDLNDPTRNVGIVGTDHEGGDVAIVFAGGAADVAIRIRKPKGHSSIAYDKWELTDAGFNALKARPIRVGARSDRLGGLKVARVVTEALEVPPMPSSTDRGNVLSTARRIDAMGSPGQALERKI